MLIAASNLLEAASPEPAALVLARAVQGGPPVCPAPVELARGVGAAEASQSILGRGRAATREPMHRCHSTTFRPPAASHPMRGRVAWGRGESPDDREVP